MNDPTSSDYLYLIEQRKLSKKRKEEREQKRLSERRKETKDLKKEKIDLTKEMRKVQKKRKRTKPQRKENKKQRTRRYNQNKPTAKIVQQNKAKRKKLFEKELAKDLNDTDTLPCSSAICETTDNEAGGLSKTRGRSAGKEV